MVPLVMPTVTAAGVWAVVRFLLVMAASMLLVFVIHAIYKDQVQVRNQIIEQTAQRAAAEARATTLEVVVTRQEARAKERDQELREARLAVNQLNSEFTDLRKNQQRVLANLNGIIADLQTKPAPEVEAKANALMDDINAQIEGVLP